MITFRVTADVKDDRRVVLTLPSDVPIGQTDLVITVNTPGNGAASTELPDWIEALEMLAQPEPEHNNSSARYPLRGSVVRYDRPTEPVAEVDWEALR